MQSLRYRFKTRLWNQLCPEIPLPARLSHGGWWLARNDALSDAVFGHIFNGPEIKFLERVLENGTKVIDIGAHLGFYTLLMSKRVGPRGRVVAFEPSPREFRRLGRHIRINRCRNVQLEELALGDRQGCKEFFVVGAPWTTRNGLRPPRIEGVQSVPTSIATLDSYLAEKDLHGIDLVKLDAEGAELEIFGGAVRLLSSLQRPLVLCEINDPVIAECGWQHRGADVIEFLEAKGFRWHGLNRDGSLRPLARASSYCGDFVAVPEERTREVAIDTRGSESSR
jgi:FkbM family methyltransferase